MANGVSVEKTAVQGGIKCCKVSIQELESASRTLKYNYQSAGAGGWRDQKYAALGRIIEECCNALETPVDELEECMKKLKALLAAVEKYESMNL